MKKLVIAFVLVIGTLIVAYLGIAYYALSNLPTGEVIQYSLKPATHRIPEFMVDLHLFFSRGDNEDVAHLKKWYGLSFLADHEEGITGKQIKIAEFYIKKGLDINHVSTADGTTALHHAAMANDHAAAHWLLSKGADPTIRVVDAEHSMTDRHIGKTPLGIALDNAAIDERLRPGNGNNRSQKDNARIIELLKNLETEDN